MTTPKRKPSVPVDINSCLLEAGWRHGLTAWTSILAAVVADYEKNYSLDDLLCNHHAAASLCQVLRGRMMLADRDHGREERPLSYDKLSDFVILRMVLRLRKTGRKAKA